MNYVIFQNDGFPGIDGFFFCFCRIQDISPVARFPVLLEDSVASLEQQLHQEVTNITHFKGGRRFANRKGIMLGRMEVKIAVNIEVVCARLLAISHTSTVYIGNCEGVVSFVVVFLVDCSAFKRTAVVFFHLEGDGGVFPQIDIQTIRFAFGQLNLFCPGEELLHPECQFRIFMDRKIFSPFTFLVIFIPIVVHDELLQWFAVQARYLAEGQQTLALGRMDFDVSLLLAQIGDFTFGFAQVVMKEVPFQKVAHSVDVPEAIGSFFKCTIIGVKSDSD
ncbi:hypothetical protein EVA_11263 [gut metagenome]|uniref:Uncharacterized protein n=1 Tax=gut metagenome TaxID=749906 RepID=J9GFR5_9ZZZZ